MAKEKYSNGDIVLAEDLESVIMYVLPVAKCTDTPSQYTPKPKVIERLYQVDKQCSEYIPKEIDEVIEDDCNEIYIYIK